MILYEGLSLNAAKVAAREGRKSPQWQNVQRTGKRVTADRICTTCREIINNDDELMQHWRECEGITPAQL